MDYQSIAYRCEDHIGYVTLNRPASVNAMNATMISELEDLFARPPRTRWACG